MKQLIAGVAAVVIAGVALYFGRAATPPVVDSATEAAPRSSAAPDAGESAIRNPQSEIETAVWALLDAANQGDAVAYADLLTGPLRDRFLEAGRDERSGAGLEQSFFGVKGIAVMAPQSSDGETWTVEAEFQYEDRKEGQRFGLRRVDGQWRFERIEPARPLEQAIPYGTPVDAVPAGPLP